MKNMREVKLIGLRGRCWLVHVINQLKELCQQAETMIVLFTPLYLVTGIEVSRESLINT